MAIADKKAKKVVPTLTTAQRQAILQHGALAASLGDTSALTALDWAVIKNEKKKIKNGKAPTPDASGSTVGEAFAPGPGITDGEQATYANSGLDPTASASEVLDKQYTLGRLQTQAELEQSALQEQMNAQAVADQQNRNFAATAFGENRQRAGLIAAATGVGNNPAIAGMAARQSNNAYNRDVAANTLTANQRMAALQSQYNHAMDNYSVENQYWDLGARVNRQNTVAELAGRGPGQGGLPGASVGDIAPLPTPVTPGPVAPVVPHTFTATLTPGRRPTKRPPKKATSEVNSNNKNRSLANGYLYKVPLTGRR